jgi:hypothetical protein
MGRHLVAAALLLSLALPHAALAGASSGPFPEPKPDPATLKLSRYEAKLWVFDRCLTAQSRLMSTTREAVHSPCSCYATKTVDQMNKTEFENFRQQSVFDETTRGKALANLDACKLKRPI